MKAVILAAGEGTRLRPFTVSKPKVMVPVANKPILEYVVEALSQNGISDITMVVGYKKERIMTHFEDGKNFKVNIDYVLQPKPLGTAHALMHAKKGIDTEFLVLSGDNIIDPKEITNLLKGEEGNAILITESETPSKYGEVFIEKGLVTKILEKPEEELSKLINTGIYRFKPNVFDTIQTVSDAGRHDMISVIQEMIVNNMEIKAVHGFGTWMDAVYPWDILHVNSSAMTGAKVGTAGTIEKNVVLKDQVSIGEESIIRSGSYIEGPAVIGKGCDIGPNTCIFPSTSIGDNVSVQPFTSIKHSIIMNDSEIGVSSIISNSVIGEGVRIGAHFVAASGEAFIHSELGDHKLEDIGTIIGEDTSIGEGVISKPGTIIGANCRISPQNKLEGEFPNKTVVI